MTYESNPREYVLGRLDDFQWDTYHLLLCCLSYMSNAQIQEMLDMNELSPRFTEDEEE